MEAPPTSRKYIYDKFNDTNLCHFGQKRYRKEMESAMSSWTYHSQHYVIWNIFSSKVNKIVKSYLLDHHKYVKFRNFWMLLKSYFSKNPKSSQIGEASSFLKNLW